jgi:DNA-binding NarL/FixJ family response regulator
VLSLIARGLCHKRVARRLNVEPSTVRTHLNDIHHRLGTTNAPHAVYVAVTTGLID